MASIAAKRVRQKDSPAPHSLSPSEIGALRCALLEWFRSCRRDLPWRRSSDPYRIWLSEIMLQQTRVAAVIPFYERFLARFPDVQSLAAAPESDLLSLWAGLGYYHRARNMQKAAKEIVARGGFPSSFDEIRALSGIGDYTAAAIASISFGLPHAVVDGNVLRVLSRILDDSSDIATLAGKRRFTRAAAGLLNPLHPGDHNQALMELGATVCLPRNPQCLVCPLAEICRARAAGTTAVLPVKTNRSQAVAEERTLFWITSSAGLLLWQRPAEARLMPGFWELPDESILPDVKPASEFGSFRHSITFHRFVIRVVSAIAPSCLGLAQWVPAASLESLPLSTIARKARRLVGHKGNLVRSPSKLAASA